MKDLLLDAHTSMTRSEEASTTFDETIDLNSPQGHFLGHFVLDLRRYPEALVAFEEAIHLDPENASAHCGKGYALLMLQHPEEALTAFNKAISLNSQDARTHHSKGIVLDALGRHPEAQEAYTMARQLGYRE